MCRALRPPFVAGLAVAAFSCGPSFQAIYEGDQKFEHCYALDESPNVRLEEKSACWREWMRSYTYGQTRDRVEHAAVRQRALSRVPELPTDEAMMEAAPGQSTSRSSIVAPAPTNAFAPPPKTLSDGERPLAREADPAAKPSPPVVFVAPSDAGRSPRPAAPGAECQDACATTWQSCQAKAEAESPGAATCTKNYRACMRACFK